MLYVDKLYIDKISLQLDKFKWLRPGVANFRCPICGDSQKRKRLKRGYFYVAKDGLQYRFCCKNCSLDKPFDFWLKKNYPDMYRGYRLEVLRYKGKAGIASFQNSKGEKKEVNEIDEDSIEELTDGHHARKYVASRLIPRKHWANIYYTPDAKETIANIVDDKTIIEGTRAAEALIFPLRKDRKLFGVVFRFFSESFRYQTLVFDEDFKKAFGLERFNRNHPSMVVEGPIDSLFLPNCLAACGADLKQLEVYFDKEKTILIYDNEPRNKDIVRSLEKAINENYTVFIPAWQWKDINDVAKAGLSTKEIIESIVKNSYRGLRARNAFIQWKKV